MLTKVTDHVARKLDRLIEQYKGKPRLAAVLTSYIEEIQELEDVFWDIINSRLVDDATGAQLKTLARLVGQPIVSSDDDILRLFVKARIRANRSNGHALDIIEVARLLFGTATFKYREQYPRGIIVDMLDPMPVDAVASAQLLRATKAGGVDIRLLWSEGAASEGLTWAAVGAESTDGSALGFADEGLTTGGKFAAIS